MNFDFKRVERKLKLFTGPKIFGIGNNETGTTSLKVAMEDLGYVVGAQRPAERMLKEWAERDFKNIIQHCRTAEFFQDFPFSEPFTFVVLDHEFPGSKFILTVRDSPEKWYNSITSFYAKKWKKNGRIPTRKDLQESTYNWKGRPWENNRALYNTPEIDSYNKAILMESYDNYNRSVLEYFRHRPEDLLVIIIAEKGAYLKLCEFLGHQTAIMDFPWENRITDIK